MTFRAAVEARGQQWRREGVLLEAGHGLVPLAAHAGLHHLGSPPTHWRRHRFHCCWCSISTPGYFVRSTHRQCQLFIVRRILGKQHIAAGIVFKKPVMPVASTLTGQLVEGEGIFGPGYLARQAREPVNFVSAIQALQGSAPTSNIKTTWMALWCF